MVRVQGYPLRGRLVPSGVVTVVTWVHIAAVGAAQFVYVGLRAVQQRFVIHNNRAFVVPTSMAMAAFEVFVYASIARAAITGTVWEAVYMAVAMGIGGGTGCLTAMRLHDRLMKVKGGKR